MKRRGSAAKSRSSGLHSTLARHLPCSIVSPFLRMGVTKPILAIAGGISPKPATEQRSERWTRMLGGRQVVRAWGPAQGTAHQPCLSSTPCAGNLYTLSSSNQETTCKDLQHLATVNSCNTHNCYVLAQRAHEVRRLQLLQYVLSVGMESATLHNTLVSPWVVHAGVTNLHLWS